MLTSATNGSAPGRLPELPPRPALREPASFLARLISEPAFLNSNLLPVPEAEGTENWYVASRRDARDGSCSLQVFVWPPGGMTRIHDHSSWGAFCCAVGFLAEERYLRLDDGSRPGHARLRKLWRRTWRREDGVSTVLPYAEGIHRVANLGTSPAISLHIYGPRLTEIDGRDYDPSHDYVCDRGDPMSKGDYRGCAPRVTGSYPRHITPFFQAHRRRDYQRLRSSSFLNVRTFGLLTDSTD